MDDIDFGVSSLVGAKRVLSGLDDMLLARGLHLNLQKTKILSPNDAREYFMPDENRYLSIFQRRVRRKIEGGDPVGTEKLRLRERFKKFEQKRRIGRWDKVFNRYLTAFGELQDDYLVAHAAKCLSTAPGSRDAVFRYFTSLGYSRRLFAIVRDYFVSEDCIDDESTFRAARLLVEWLVPPTSKTRNEIVQMVLKDTGKSVSRVTSCIWLLAKYGSASDIEVYLGTTTFAWKHSAFLCRQVAALHPLFRKNSNLVHGIRRTFIETGNTEALAVIDNLHNIRLSNLSMGLRSHVLHGSGDIKVYPLPKFIIAINILSSDHLTIQYRQDLRDQLLNRVIDPIYQQSLKRLP